MTSDCREGCPVNGGVATQQESKQCFKLTSSVTYPRSFSLVVCIVRRHGSHIKRACGRTEHVLV